MFVAFGGAAMVVARDYPMGTASRMGPGYFPMVIGAMLVLLGLAVAARGFWRAGPSLPRLPLRAVVVVLAAIVAFALLVDSAGLVVATAALIVVSRLGWWELRPREIVVLVVLLTALACGLFVWGLGLPFRVWPR
jgi:putative tricarboxylic transport membrane protein